MAENGITTVFGWHYSMRKITESETAAGAQKNSEKELIFVTKVLYIERATKKKDLGARYQHFHGSSNTCCCRAFIVQELAQQKDINNRKSFLEKSQPWF